jgi:hypothetical protein
MMVITCRDMATCYVKIVTDVSWESDGSILRV